MKKKIIIILLTLLCIVAVWMIGSGFTVQTSVYITDDFIVSEEEDEITFTVGIGSAMGFVRDYKDEGGGVKPHYLKFYSAWGGLNSSIGAKNKFTLELSPEDTEIYVYHGNGGYDLVLEKNSVSGEWQRVK